MIPTRWKWGLDGLIKVAKAAENAGAQIRAVGAAWSLSVETRYLNEIIDIGVNPTHLAPGYVGYANEPTPGDHLCLVQCGASVAHINHALAVNGLSMRTCGASNGQTIAGAIATGTHGASLDVGSMHDAVAGLHIIGGNGESFWVERESEPVAGPTLLAGLNATAIRSDDVFNAALVSFGAFGIVHAVMLRIEPLYLLKVYRWRSGYNGVLRKLSRTLNFDVMKIPGQAAAMPRPDHFEFVLDPYHPGNAAYVAAMYKKDAPQDYEADFVTHGGTLGSDMMHLASKLAGMAPNIAKMVLSDEVADGNPLMNVPGAPDVAARSMGEVFYGISAGGLAGSTEIGVALADAERAIDVVLDTIVEFEGRRQPYLGLIAVRYIPKSKATLAFSRFNMTCTIELACVRTRHTSRFFRTVWENLAAADVLFTLHWGQENHLSKQRVLSMYGAPAVKSWVDARAKLLPTDEARQTYANAFTDRCGLS